MPLLVVLVLSLYFIRCPDSTVKRVRPILIGWRRSRWTTARSGTQSQERGHHFGFIHSGWLNSDTWRAQVEHYADSYRVITYDIRGHGRTGATDRRRYSINLFVDDLERLLDHLGIARSILCGLSLGSMIVQEYLDRHPDQVARAILAGPIQSMPPVDLPHGMKPFVSPLLALTASLATAGSRATFRSLLGGIQMMTGGPWLTVDPDVRSQAIEMVGGVPRTKFSKIFDALYGFEPPDLSRVATPTHVMYDEHEAAPVKRQGGRIAASVRDGRRQEIPDAGHLVSQDNPKAFNSACADFLAEDGIGTDAGREQSTPRSESD